MQFKKILIAVDNTPQSSEAARAGFELANRLGAQVALLYVTEIIVDLHAAADTGMPIDITPIDMISMQKEETVKTLEQITQEFGDGRAVVNLNPQGSPRVEIIAEAEKWGSDMIVMGTHGHTGLTHLILGSVAEYVVRHSKVPVMVVPLRNA